MLYIKVIYMKKIKRISVFLLSFLILVYAVPFSASASQIGYGDFYFELNATTKEATLVEYTGTDLTEIDIPDNVNGYKVTSIDKNVFYNNTVIEKVGIPITMKNIGDYAFSGCTSLKEVILPWTVSTMGHSVFYGCSSLENAYVNALISAVPADTFNNCSSLKNVVLSITIKSIGKRAFFNCTSLSAFPDCYQITEIEQSAFSNSGLVELDLPDSLESISSKAFSNCQELKTVIASDMLVNVSADAFKNSPNLTIYGNEGSYAQQYATENKIPFVMLPKYKNGDVNLDGTISVDDVTFLQMHIARYNNFVSDDSYKVADFDGNGMIDINDVTMIQLYLVGHVA